MSLKTRALLLPALVAAFFATGASAAPPPPSPGLAGENLQSASATVTANCNSHGGGTISWQATGLATGPYAGTFTSSGTAKFPNEGNPTNVTFQEKFTISSPSGSVIGFKEGTLEGHGRCDSSLALAEFFTPTVPYRAAIKGPAGGVAKDSGITTPFVGRGPTFTQFGELFDASFEVVGLNDKDQCKKGGWETFLVFKNQGDCVSFIATGGKNQPAGA
jgi:hypothetical protein